MMLKSCAFGACTALLFAANVHCSGGGASGAADTVEAARWPVDGDEGAVSEGAAGDDGGVDDSGSWTCSRAAIGRRLAADLANVTTDVDFSLYLERSAGGDPFVYHRGASSLTKEYESASTSKWVTAAVVLWVVDQGKLRLTDRPQDHLPDWPLAHHPKLGGITLSQLLSFTSGLTEDALCQNLPDFDFWRCVDNIGTRNEGNTTAPGAVFHYASSHLQVAGAMAVRAAGLGSWEALFERFKAQTGLFAHSRYDLPSAQNPRLAGGMTWTGHDYIEFVRAFRDAKFYASDWLVRGARIDHTARAVIGASPAKAALNEDWHYGYGLWIECHRSDFDPSACLPAKTISSPGAYGAYPFLDLEDGYLGLVARQGALGTFADGYAVFEAVRSTADAWARCESP